MRANGLRYIGLADGLRAWRNRPEPTIEPLQTNWRTQPANDNADPEEVADYGFERHLRITPSVEEIMRNVADGPTERNEAGQIIRIGKLRFSDGGQTERAYCYGVDGKLLRYDAYMPVGAMLGTRDKPEGQLGGRGYSEAEVETSNRYFADVLKTLTPRYVRRTKRKNGKSYTADESRAMLAAAYANTPVLPKIEKLPPGLPCATRRVAECFVGMQKGKKGESGAIAWEDIASSIVSREIWSETLAAMRKEHKRTMDRAMTAKNTYAIGSAEGYSGRSAWRHGKAALLAANDNFQRARRSAA